jgi:phosphate:Na+ symporter
MDALGSVIGGLGLFFVGVRLIGFHIRQLAGRRLRQLIGKAVQRTSTTALFGAVAGMLMQSVNAVTFVLVALVSAGTLEHRRALPIIAWANIGTSMLLLFASLPFHQGVLLLAGLTGLLYYYQLDQSVSHKHKVGAALGVCLLFLGVDFLKLGASALRDAQGFALMMQSVSSYPVLAFALGAAAAWAVQSATTVSLVAMALAHVGLLNLSAGEGVVLGAGLGSALSAWTLAGRLSGSSRQLITYQILLRGVGVAAMVSLLLADRYLADGVVTAAVRGAVESPSTLLAVVYLMLQVVSALMVWLLHKPIVRLLARWAPPSEVERLGRPKYLNDEALADPESAMQLAHREQLRMLSHLPMYLDDLRDETRGRRTGAAERSAAEGAVLKECDHFLREITDRHTDREVLEQVLVLRDRNQLLMTLQESLTEFDQTIRAAPAENGGTRELLQRLVESLHAMLQVCSDAARSGDETDRAILRQLTFDRSDLMTALRRRPAQSDVGNAASSQEALFASTGIFERCVWLLRRYSTLMSSGETTS